MASFRRATHLFQSAAFVSPVRPAYAAGARASLATVAPLAIGLFLNVPSAATWMSLAGFNASLSDRGGSYKTRALTMSATIGACLLTTLLATLASAHFSTALLATFVVAFCASLLRVYGLPGISVSGASLSSFVVALAIEPEPGAWYLRPLFLIIGGAWAMGIALVLWPLRPYRPARLAVAECYRQLAIYINDVGQAASRKDTAEWPVQHGLPAITLVRQALEAARETLVQLRRGRPGSGERGERLLVLSESADQLFGHVVALSDMLATIRDTARHEPLHGVCIDLLHQISESSRALAVGIEEEDRQFSVAIHWNGEALRAAINDAGPGGADAQYEHIAQIFDRASQFASSASRSAEALNRGTPDTDAVPSPVEPLSPGRSPDPQSSFDSLRALLSPGSLLLRFAGRVAIVTTAAVAFTELLDIKRGYWVTLTAIVILQPYTGVTLTRALQRVMGTVLGGLLAAALGAYFRDPRAILVIATVFVACCVALLPINYAAFSVFLTPTFVLLAEAGAGEWHLAETRVLNTLLGGALALLGSRMLWPSPERTRFPTYGAAALRANADYLNTVMTGFDDRGRPAGEQMRAARRAIGLATANAEESLQRALNEAHGDHRTISPALTLLAYTRRFTGTIAALAISRHSALGSVSPLLRPFSDRAVVALNDLAAALDDSRAPNPLMPMESLSVVDSPILRARLNRIARQIKTMHDAVARMTTAT